ncbi:MAG: TIM barrel protein [Thermoguttaceae bacterium]
MSALTPGRRLAFSRRSWLQMGAGLVSGAGLARLGGGLARAAEPAKATDLQRSTQSEKPAPLPKPTQFQIACMTLPYAQFPLERALEGIRAAGYRYVAWGTTHKGPATDTLPILAPDDPPEKARDLGRHCRDLGLEPLLMFSGIYPEAPQALAVLTRRIEQAAAAGIGQVLTFGHTQGGSRRVWIERFKQLGPIARGHGVLLVVKQHGGTTGTGAALAAIVREVNDAGIMVNYDAGNVLDYLNLDPIPDLHKCVPEIRSFCIKDHRNWPRSEDCGPGFGEIDHYRLLRPVTFTGLKMPLCCENIFAPLVPRPAAAEEIDALARRAREFLEVVVRGLQTAGPE